MFPKVQIKSSLVTNAKWSQQISDKRCCLNLSFYNHQQNYSEIVKRTWNCKSKKFTCECKQKICICIKCGYKLTSSNRSNSLGKNWTSIVWWLTCQLADRIWLAVVFAHVGVHKIHNIRANGGPEDSRHDYIFAWWFSFVGIHRDEGSGTGLRM